MVVAEDPPPIGLVTGRRAGRMVFYRLTVDFPEPLREHCLRRLVDLSRRAKDDADDTPPS